MIYADTNLLLSLVRIDSLTNAAETWFESVAEPVAMSPWTMLEFRANIGVRVRKKLLTHRDGLAALAEFDHFADTSLHSLIPAQSHFLKARDWLAHPDCALRSGDALHLAIAFGHGCRQFATFDQPLGASAKKLKLPVLVLKAYPAHRIFPL